MEDPGIGGSDAIPAQRMDEGAEVAGIVEAVFANGLPGLSVQDFGRKLQFPYDFEGLALGVVVKAGKTDKGAGAVGLLLDGPHEIGAGADADNLAGLGEFGVRGVRCLDLGGEGCGHWFLGRVIAGSGRAAAAREIDASSGRI